MHRPKEKKIFLHDRHLMPGRATCDNGNEQQSERCAYLESREMCSGRGDLSRNENPTPLQVLLQRINCAGSVIFTIAPKKRSVPFANSRARLPAHASISFARLLILAYRWYLTLDNNDIFIFTVILVMLVLVRISPHSSRSNVCWENM